MNSQIKEIPATIEYLEFDKYILLYGSMINILENSSVNLQNFVVKLINNEEMIRQLMKVTGTESAYEIFSVIMNRIPQTLKSKTIVTQLKKHGSKLNKISI